MCLSARARFLLTLVCATGLLMLPAGASAAGSSPVHVDPKSPVAKEYALPLASARGAAPESGKSGNLFGAGIKHSTKTVTHAASPPPTETVTSSAAQPPAAQTPAAQTPAPTPPVTTPSVQEPTPITTTTATDTTRTTATTTTRRQTASRHVTTVTLPELTAATGSREVRAAPAAYQVLEPGSGSGVLWMVLAAVLVIVLGSVGGVLLGRRR